MPLLWFLCLFMSCVAVQDEPHGGIHAIPFIAALPAAYLIFHALRLRRETDEAVRQARKERMGSAWLCLAGIAVIMLFGGLASCDPITGGAMDGLIGGCQFYGCRP